ncbi:MAG: cardiolipin synthase [Desulfobulbus sp.]|nr:cardiolipin synthase [Desulfobulbus sp.]
MESLTWNLASTFLHADLAICIGLSLRVIMRKRAPSVSFAWVAVILLMPFGGALLYLLFGEYRLSERRATQLAKERPVLRKWSGALRDIPASDQEGINPECQPLHVQILTTTGMPTMPGNRLELIDTADRFFTLLLDDIRRASSSCFLEFYILNEGGQVDELIVALLEAQQRGVVCRILLDAIGAKRFLRSRAAQRLRQGGVEVVAALPAGLFRALFVRIDLRNHRKIAVVDGEIAYTGSQNLVDPRFFKQEDGVGEWVDAMVRITGPVVELLAATFLFDWLLERGQNPTEYQGITGIRPAAPTGKALVQLAPSGPGYGEDTIHNLLLTAIYAARQELILTTPYFVPDNAILAALRSAAQRGVAVTLIIPEKNDSRLVHYASRSRFETLSQAGVRIMGFHGGLLHTKSITVDDNFCLLGSVNLDMRSFWLNYEMTLVIYDRSFANRVREMQCRYLEQAREHDAAAFAARPYRQRLLENIALLLGPLL